MLHYSTINESLLPNVSVMRGMQALKQNKTHFIISHYKQQVGFTAVHFYVALPLVTNWYIKSTMTSGKIIRITKIAYPKADVVYKGGGGGNKSVIKTAFYNKDA